MGPTGGDIDRLLRGGSWGYRASNVRAAFRIWDRPDQRFDVFGFRCARGQGPELSLPLLRRGGAGRTAQRPAGKPLGPKKRKK